MKKNIGKFLVVGVAMLALSGCIPGPDKPPVYTNAEVESVDTILQEFDELDFSDSELYDF